MSHFVVWLYVWPWLVFFPSVNIRWHTHGLAAMLEDHDGLGPNGDMRDESLTTAGKDSIKTSDVLALLEAKYSTLHDRVLMELASRVASSSSGAMLYSVGDHVLPYSTVPCCFQDFNHLACSQPFDKSVGHLLSLFPSAAFSFHHSRCYEMF